MESFTTDYHLGLGSKETSPLVESLSTYQANVELVKGDSEIDNIDQTINSKLLTQIPSKCIVHQEELMPHKQRVELSSGSEVDNLVLGSYMEDGELELKVEDTFDIPSMKRNIEILWEWLNNEHYGIIGIQGDPLMGKTFTAEKLLERARAVDLFDVFIWVHDTQNSYETLMQIADQLELQLSESHWVDTYVKERNLKKTISESLEAKHFLLIIDDISSCDLRALGIPFPKEQKKSSKVLLVYGNGMNFTVDKVQKLEKLSDYEAWLLFQKISSTDSYAREMTKPLLDSCKGVPFEIAIRAGALRNFRSESNSGLVRSQLLEDVHRACDLICGASQMSHIQFICEMLPDKDVQDFFLFCSIYPKYYHFSVDGLIAAWIRSGFLDGLGCLEKAYDKGSTILQELIDRHLLIKRTGEVICVQTQLMNEAREYIMNNGYDIHFLKKLSVAAGSGMFRKQGGPILLKKDDLLLNYSDNVGGDESLLLYGKKDSVLPDEFFDDMSNLQDVSLLQVQFRSLPESLLKLNNLGVLVVRGCDFLENVSNIRGFQNLRVFSLSGSRSLKELPDDFFEHMHSLENLDLSNTQLRKLPSSFSNLSNITFLMLGGCTQLETLPSMKEYRHLYLLDLSNASGLRTPPDTSDSLRMLDLSGTLVERLPSLSSLKNLEYLILRGCSRIKTVPHPYEFPQLKVLDLSGATAFMEFEAEMSASDSSLVKLDLSETLIAEVPTLSRCIKLCEVLLRSCPNLVSVPQCGASVQVLDLSGSNSIQKFHAELAVNGLRIIDLSRTRINMLHVEAANLVQLLLTECEYLEELPHSEFPNLQVLDLSGAVNFNKFKDESLGTLCCLVTLNLSATKIGKVPTLSGCSHLRHILLKGCLELETLPELKTLTKLEVLDVSGATAFKYFHDDSFTTNEHFRELNLSETQIVDIPMLSGNPNLQKLIFKDCPNLERLPSIEVLTRLLILDLSGTTSFTTFQDQSFGIKPELEILDLSGTVIEVLPTLSGCTNLSQLSLRDCQHLMTLPPLKELTKLEVLDLSGATSFSHFQDESLGSNCALRKLNLSLTKVADFSFFSRCQTLSKLSLRQCLGLENLSFEGMLNLQKLDLSESLLVMLSPTISKLVILRQLLLKGCSSLTKLPHLELLTELEVLDLSGTSIEYPDGISQLPRLWSLRIWDRKYIWGFLKDNTGKVIKKLNSEPTGTEDYLHVTVSDADIFLPMEKNMELIVKFHFCLCSAEEWGKEKDIYLQEKRFSFHDIYYQTMRIRQSTEEPYRFFKICGFKAFPHGIEPVLKNVELLYLKKNDFLSRLSDIGTENVGVMRECWIERCNKMECGFYEEEENKNLALGRCLENLCLSNLSVLKCLFKGEMPPGSFTCLKHIYIECCPRLVTLFSWHVELNELETLKIKFCDQLQEIFGDEMQLGEQCLPKLKTLVLWQLPKLHGICGGVLGSLRNLTVKGCLQLQRIPVNASCGVKIKGDTVWWNNMKFQDEHMRPHLRFTSL